MIKFIIVLALLVGWFLNVCICCIPKGKSVLCLSSHCLKCETRLKPIYLVPVLSYIFSKRKCKYCGEKISIQYPIVELLNALIYLLLYMKYGLSLYFFKYAILSSLLIVISFIDLKYQIIPDRLNLFCLVVGILFTLPYGDIWLIMNGAVGLFVGGGLFLLIAIVTRGAMGGGDIKLMGALGFYFGWQYIIFIALLSFIIGAIISIILLAFKIKSRKDYIPFGPFISISAIVAMTYGQEIIEWYLRWVLG